MKTSLNFEAPPDLSVGTVRIEGQRGTLKEWIATPGNRRLDNLEAEPGFYIAEIAPAGLRPQSVIFEVRANVANNVVTPVFSALSAEGNSPTFINVSNHGAAIEALGRGRALILPRTKFGDEAQPTTAFKRVRSAERKKRLTIALSTEAEPGSESWRPFPAPTSVELVNGALNIIVHNATRPLRPRARLSLALERVRVERLLLPLYFGGTIVSAAPSQLSTSDVSLQVAPADAATRALLRALGAGAHDEAVAVEEGLLQRGNPSRYLDGPEADPWAAMLALLLSLRFPEVFGKVERAHAARLLELAPWAYDAHVILARSVLMSAGPNPEARRNAAAEAVTALAKASALGAPYYSYSNQLIGEMLAALSAPPGVHAKATEKARTLLARWQRNLALQSGSAGSFTWCRRDAKRLAQGVLARDRSTTGTLNDRHSTIIFRGRVEIGRITIDTARRTTHKASPSRTRPNDDEYGEPLSVAPTGVPALGRPRGPADDPNKGRFGGQAARGGYRLRAKFERSRSKNWVPLTLLVEADDSESALSGQPVYFCLHPTFDTTWIKGAFRGRRGSVSVKAWGGFTVGAWLPEQQVELELDLAELPDAPSIIREL